MVRIPAGLAVASGALFTMALAAIIGGCDKSPSGPSPPFGPLVRLELDIPRRIAPGATVQLHVTAVYSQGREDVTDRTSWRSTQPDVLEVDSTGRATGKTDGESAVQITYGGITTGRGVFVLPPDTWVLGGRVHDGGLSVAGARLEVVAGAGTGKSTVASDSGNFRFYGVGGDIRLRTAASGFQFTEVAQSVVADMFNVNILLQPDQGTRTMAGEWTLTFEAAANCQALPPDAHRRTYAATVLQSGASLLFTLGGAEFVYDTDQPPVLQNSFRGRIAGDTLTLVLAQVGDTVTYALHADVMERLDSDSVLTLVGAGATTATGDDLSGIFTGTFEVGSGTRVSGSCTGDHRFSLRK